jgi:hypothetical protein
MSPRALEGFTSRARARSPGRTPAHARTMQLLDRKLRLISSVKAEQEAATQGNIDPDQVRQCRPGAAGCC